MKVLTKQQYSNLIDEILLLRFTSNILYSKLLGYNYHFEKHKTRQVYFYHIYFQVNPGIGYIQYYHFWLKTDSTRKDIRSRIYKFFVY